MTKFIHNGLRIAFACLALVLLTTQPAEAQRRGQRAPRLGHVTTLQLLSREEVRKELKLTGEQQAKIDQINTKMTSDRRTLFAATPKDSGERADKVAELNRQVASEVDQLLDGAQRKRLGEIVLQVNGAAELENAEVRSALGITGEQEKQLSEIRRDSDKASREALKEMDGASAEERNAKLAELFRKANEKMLQVLTPDQRKQFESMQGEKLALNLFPS